MRQLHLSAPTEARRLARASSAEAPKPDPRVGLKAGRMDAAEATWNLRVVSKTPPSQQFVGQTNSDLAFIGNYVIQGSYNGYQVWDISNPAPADPEDGLRLPRLAERRVGLQEPALRLGREPGRPARLRDPGRGGHGQHRAAPRHPHLRHHRHHQARGTSATCRPAAARTPTPCWWIPKDKENVYVYISGSARVRPDSELPGCVQARQGSQLGALPDRSHQGAAGAIRSRRRSSARRGSSTTWWRRRSTARRRRTSRRNKKQLEQAKAARRLHRR